MSLINTFSSIFGRARRQAATELDPSQVEAFFKAVETGGAEQVRELIRINPALVTVRNAYGFQPIHVLDYTDFSLILDLLLNNGARIDDRTSDGQSLLHLLVDCEMLPAVLLARPTIDLRDHTGATPLMAQITCEDPYEMVEALLEVGANPNACDDAGNTALSVARRRQDAEVADLLITNGARDDCRPDPAS